METLIELYDERAIENILGPMVFKPKKVIYLCPDEIASDKEKQNILREFFAYEGLGCDVEFAACSLYKADTIYRLLKKKGDENPDCAIDITGGTDAALFAAGAY